MTVSGHVLIIVFQMYGKLLKSLLIYCFQQHLLDGLKETMSKLEESSPITEASNPLTLDIDISSSQGKILISLDMTVGPLM